MRELNNIEMDVISGGDSSTTAPVCGPENCSDVLVQFLNSCAYPVIKEVSTLMHEIITTLEALNAEAGPIKNALIEAVKTIKL